MIPEEKANVLALMRRLREMNDEDYLQNLIAYHAAPTILGVKPATLVCPGAVERNLEQALAECSERLERTLNITIASFRNRAGALLLFVYNAPLLRSTLFACDVAELLRDAGYDAPTAGIESLLERLRRKCAESAFPHEIGVFLGYPAADVKCFMNRGGKDCRAVCCWKTYGDVKEATRRSSRYTRAKMTAAQLIVRGAGLSEVANGLRAAV